MWAKESFSHKAGINPNASSLKSGNPPTRLPPPCQWLYLILNFEF
ncbi:hypothetical protein FDUTEX481_02742 [Tolypothrix sp. PCC 7601]|nr:hypothetical protein FDUTEX481_02742 [Tolypothrix sp. PCC 7601]